ncbi:MAG: cation diffusion facilitator family transporter [Pyrinomonadaceae bacterium]
MKEDIDVSNTPLIGAGVNALLAVIKIAGGLVGNSGALVADGVESSTDVVSSLVVWGGLRVSVKPPDEDHPYGHGKAEPLAAVAASFALLAAAVWIAFESVRQILTPHATPRWYTLIILAGVIGVKALLSRFVSHAGQEVESTALKSDALHHLSDALTSLAAFIGISIALIGGRGYESADDWAALVACIIISYNGVRLLKDAINEVLDVAPSPEYEGKIRVIARNVEGVIDVEKCRIRKSGLHHLIDIHVVVDGEMSVRRGHQIAHQVKDALLDSEHRVVDVLVHIEPH